MEEERPICPSSLIKQRGGEVHDHRHIQLMTVCEVSKRAPLSEPTLRARPPDASMKEIRLAGLDIHPRGRTRRVSLLAS
jgi:hypothetical protein